MKKFRIWDKKYKKYLTVPPPGAINFGSTYSIISSFISIIDIPPNRGCYICNEKSFDEDRFLIQEFTGLIDSKGNQVFVGDLLKYTFSPDEHGDIETDIEEVVFENYSYGVKSQHFSDLVIAPHFSCVVVGNTLECPE